MKYQVIVQGLDFLEVEADSEEQAKEIATDISKSQAFEWTLIVTKCSTSVGVNGANDASKS